MDLIGISYHAADCGRPSPSTPGPRDERARGRLVAAVRVALAAQRLGLGRRDPGHLDDAREDHRLAAERDQAPRREREAVDRMAEPDAPLEKVVGVARVGP